MNTKAWIVTIAGSLLLACSSPPNAGFNTGGGDNGSSGSGSSGSGASSGNSSGSGTSSGASSGGGTSGGSSSGVSSSGTSSGSGSSGVGGSSGGDGGPVKGLNWGTKIPTTDLGPVVTLAATPFQVAAGAEVYKCQVFANPFANVNTDIVSMHGTMSAGSHHFFLFNMSALEAAAEPPVGTLGNCTGNGLEFHPFPFLSQTQDWSVNYPTAPDGTPMGYPLVGANYLMINVHYLNTGATPITASVSIDITPAKAGVVTTHVGSIFLNQTTASVAAGVTMANPAHTNMIWGGDPGVLPASYSIFTSWSHMHRWAMNFTATTGGNTFYTETNWDSPNLFIHAPGMTEPPTATGAKAPIQMTGNPSITWDCTYYNDTGAALTFGDSAKNNVMCIYIGQYYPANPSAPDDIAVLN